MKRFAVVLAVAVALPGCMSIQDAELPNEPEVAAEPTIPPPPVVVQPVPIPSPVNGPAPTPAPVPTPNTPNPTPRPTSTPPPGGGATGPTAQVTAGVHSYLHNGQLVPRTGTEFSVGDVLYLNCTPRDSAGQPIGNHGPLQGWFHQGTAAYRITDTNSFTPDLHAQGAGYVDISCQVDGVRAPWKRLTIR